MTLKEPHSGIIIQFSATRQREEIELSSNLGPLYAAQIGLIRAWCYGEIHSYHADDSTMACLLHALEDFVRGRLAPACLNGRFVLFFQDQISRRWTIITDRMGAQHLYAVYRSDRVAALGTDLLTLAHNHSSQNLDWHALSGFFTYGFFSADCTYFTDTKVLLPASVYTFDAEGRLLDHYRHWNWHHTVDESRSYDQTIARYDDLLRHAVTRTAVGSPLLPLSGGLDSRSLAYCLPPTPQTRSYAYGYTPDSVETRLAGQIARTRSLTFTAHTIGPYLFERLLEITRMLHGSQDLTLARQMSINGWMHEQADAVLSGLWGDVWCDQMGLANYPTIDELPTGVTLAIHVHNKTIKNGHRWLIEHLVIPNFDRVSLATDVDALLLAATEAGMKQFAGIADPDFQVKAYKTTYWAFRWSNASLRGFDAGAVARVPYYDIDLIDFFCTVPTRFVQNRRLQIDHLKRYAPDLARIGWQAAEANLYLAPVGRWISLPRRAFKKAKCAVTGAPPIQRNWEVQFLSAGQREHLERWLLTPDLPLLRYVSHTEVKHLLDSFYLQPDAATGYTVSMLLTFSAWLVLLEED